jgi:hypothetical protein
MSHYSLRRHVSDQICPSSGLKMSLKRFTGIFVCIWVCQRFRVPCCLHHQGDQLITFILSFSLALLCLLCEHTLYHYHYITIVILIKNVSRLINSKHCFRSAYLNVNFSVSHLGFRIWGSQGVEDFVVDPLGSNVAWTFREIPTSALKMEAVCFSENVGICVEVHTALQPRRPASTLKICFL